MTLEGGISRDDLADFDAWRIYEPPEQNRAGQGQEAILLIAKEAGSGVFTLVGDQFKWKQLGI